MALWPGPLPTEALTAWAHRPGCGAVVTFAGTTRDHGAAPNGGIRTGVTLLEYEAYLEPALHRLVAVAESVLVGWEDCGAVVVAHRLGPVPLGEASVLVVVASPHRDAAFAAARHAIDATKATVPIWKREHHDAGVDWGADATPLGAPAVARAGGARAGGGLGPTSGAAMDAGVTADDGAVVRPGGPVADTGGAARRAVATGEAAPVCGASPSQDRQERTWAI